MRGGRGRRVAPPPDGPSALGAGMRQSRDLTSGAGVLSSRGAPRVPAGPPRSVTGRRGRGEGVRFVADGGRPFLRADRPPPPPLPVFRAALPCSFLPCPAARRRRRRRRAERERPCSRCGPEPRRGRSVPTVRAATLGGGASSPSDPRPPALAEGDGAGLRIGGGGGGGGESGRPAPCGLLAARAGRPPRSQHGGAAGEWLGERGVGRAAKVMGEAGEGELRRPGWRVPGGCFHGPTWTSPLREGVCDGERATGPGTVWDHVWLAGCGGLSCIRCVRPGLTGQPLEKV